MTPAKTEWYALASYALALSDQLRQAPYSGIVPDTRLLAEAAATMLSHLSRLIFADDLKALERATVYRREGTMKLQIKLTPDETAIWYGRNATPQEYRTLIKKLFSRAIRLATNDGNAVDIVDCNGAILDTID